MDLEKVDMNYEQIKEGYRQLRLKYFSNPDYTTLADTGWTLEDLEDLYEFNFLAVLLHGGWNNGFTTTTKEGCTDIKNYKKYPQINWRAYIDYIDEVQKTLPTRDSNEIEIYKAVDSIRSEFGIITNNQQLWI